MTRTDDFIQQLESYLDEYEGLTPLPEGVRDAVRAELPLTNQAGPLPGPARYLPMSFSKAAGIGLAAAAAVLVVAVGAFVLRAQSVGPPGPSPTATATAEAAVCERTTAVAGAPGTIEVDWCANGANQPGAVSFTMDAPAAWVDQYFAGFGSLWLRPEGGGAITFAIHPDESVDDVIADVSGREGYVVENLAPVALGGAPAQTFDLSLAAGANSNDTEPLITDPDQTWQLQEGRITRVWIVDVDGQTVLIATGEGLADAVGESLETIQWGS